MANDTGGNVQVDFIYGNMPMQPDDQRLGDADSTDPLDPTEGDHDRAVSGYLGFPQVAAAVSPYADLVDNKVVPDVVGMSDNDAQTAIENLGLVYALGAVVDNAGGATALNDTEAASQLPVADTVVNEGATVTVRYYEYTP